MIRVSTSNVSRRNTSVIFPVLGVVSFNKEGFAEIEEKLWKDYLIGVEDDDFSLTPCGDIVEEQGERNERLLKETETSTLNLLQDKEKLEKDLVGMKVNELRELASAYSDKTGFPLSDWESLKKDELVSYLVDRL